MGLDLASSNHTHSFRVGSYSGVHDARVGLIRLVLDNIPDLTADTRYLLTNWLPDPSSPSQHPDYDCVSDYLPLELAEQNLAGLYWYVNHSDCDGVWSHGQVVDIRNLLQLLKVHGLTNPYWLNFAEFCQNVIDDSSYVIFA